MKFETFKDILIEQIKDLFSAETQLVKALPKIAERVSDDSLRDTILSHLRETENHVIRLETIGERMGVSLRGKKCQGMKGLIAEAKEILDAEGEANVIDAALIAAAQRVEHYEIAAYGCAREFASELGLSEEADLLQATLNEESMANEKLNQIAMNQVNLRAKHGRDEAQSDVMHA